jgi:hypothetical protein
MRSTDSSSPRTLALDNRLLCLSVVGRTTSRSASDDDILELVAGTAGPGQSNATNCELAIRVVDHVIEPRSFWVGLSQAGVRARASPHASEQ